MHTPFGGALRKLALTTAAVTAVVSSVYGARIVTATDMTGGSALIVVSLGNSSSAGVSGVPDTSTIAVIATAALTSDGVTLTPEKAMLVGVTLICTLPTLGMSTGNVLLPYTLATSALNLVQSIASRAVATNSGNLSLMAFST